MELLGTKAEIKLRKAGPASWSSLELVKKQPATNDSNTSKDKTTKNADNAKADTTQTS